MNFTYSKPGIYQVYLRATTDGITTVSRTYVSVVRAADIDSVVRLRWAQLNGAIASRSIDGAIKLFSSDSREKYRRIYGDLFEQLPSITAGMTLRGAISIHADYVDYLVTRVEDGVTRGYHLTMIRDEAGLWKVTDL